MKIITETSLNNFEAWEGAKQTLQEIREAGKVEDLEMLLDDIYPDGIDDVKLNDILWFDNDWVFESLGMKPEEEEV
jgi:hypothetical protein